MSELRADVVIVGAGAAGMYAAIEARRAGAEVLLIDKGMVGRGGATVMAQMTVAAAVGHAEPDDPELHYADTLAGGKGIVNEPLAALMCAGGPEAIFDTRAMGVAWAAHGDRLDQVMAPGHSRRRCCYVGALQTGTGVSRGMRKELRRLDVAHHNAVAVSGLVKDGEEVVGVAALDIRGGEPLAFWGSAVVLACGGLTEMYARNSASVNMTGDAYALALAAGAELVDMEMVQFFPIAHLAPRLVGIDPIMWDPFRYRLGGRLLNGLREEFVGRYASQDDRGQYRATRDEVTYAILKEVEAGRGSPHGGAWLDFTGISPDKLRDAFPAVIERLAAQGLDLSSQPVEVAPMAHYTIGGIRADRDMATGIPRLYAAGEAVGGAHGANRLSGNALTEAFVFGAEAGRSAARHASADPLPAAPSAAARRQMREAHARLEALPGRNTDSAVFLPALRRRLQQVMSEKVGPLRTEAGLRRAAEDLAELRELHARARVDARRRFNREWSEWVEFDGMLRTAEAVRVAALARRESRGAHQREDVQHQIPEGVANTVVRDRDGALHLGWAEVVRDRPDVARQKEKADASQGRA